MRYKVFWNESIGDITNMSLMILENELYSAAEPAAVQDIGVLSNELDGIIPLSFLKVYANIKFDFQTKE